MQIQIIVRENTKDLTGDKSFLAALKKSLLKNSNLYQGNSRDDKKELTPGKPFPAVLKKLLLKNSNPNPNNCTRG